MWMQPAAKIFAADYQNMGSWNGTSQRMDARNPVRQSKGCDGLPDENKETLL